MANTVRRSGYGVIILAAGRGERMKELGPKPLIEVGGKPLLTYSLELARHYGGEGTVVLLSEDAKSGVNLLSSEQKYSIIPPLGTAYAVEQALDQLPSSVEHLVICQADDAALYPIDIFDRLTDVYAQANVNIALTTTRVTQPLSLGSLQVSDEGIVESINFDPTLPSPKLALCGLYLIQKETFLHYAPLVPPNEKNERSIPRLLQVALQEGEKIQTMEIPEGQWSNINSPNDLNNINDRL